MPSRKRPGVSPKTRDQLFAHLDSLPDPPPPDLTLRKTVEELRSRIRALLKRGYSFAQIAQQFESQGVHIAESTLRVYSAQPRKKKNSAPSDVRKASAPAQTQKAKEPLKSLPIRTYSKEDLI